MGIIKRKYQTKKHQKPVIQYRAEVYIKGVRILAKSFSTKKEAILWHEKEKNKFTMSSTSTNDQMLFKKCVDEFLIDAKTRLAKSTYQKYECQLIYLYSSPLAKLQMSKFKGIKIVEWLSWLKKHPTAKNNGRKSFIHELKLLSTILNWYKNFINEDFNVPITKKHKQMCIFKHIPQEGQIIILNLKMLKSGFSGLRNTETILCIGDSLFLCFPLVSGLGKLVD